MKRVDVIAALTAFSTGVHAWAARMSYESLTKLPLRHTEVISQLWAFDADDEIKDGICREVRSFVCTKP